MGMGILIQTTTQENTYPHKIKIKFKNKFNDFLSQVLMYILSSHKNSPNLQLCQALGPYID